MINVTDTLGLKNDAPDELILRKIHFQRVKKDFPDIVNDYLCDRYLKTNDVRFFNELLWLVKGDISKIKQSIDHFNLNFIDSKHIFCYGNNLKYCLNIYNAELAINKDNFKNKEIALIGNPVHFILPFLKFKKNNIPVDIINVKFHPNKIIGVLFFNIFFSYIFKLIFGKSYHEININKKSELNTFKIHKKYHVGFHKLNFIIKDNIISNFSLGLINDHWGALPLFKGRSTLHYSRLFGANQVITNHLINNEIDSGKVLMYTRINSSQTKKIIYLKLKDRIYNSINLLSKSCFIDVDNKLGYMFYEMHPWLIKKIKK